MCFYYHHLVLRWSGTIHGLTNGIKAKVMSLSRESLITREDCWGYVYYIITPYNNTFDNYNWKLENLFLGCVWIPLILLKIENWKYCSKIIFKCVNSAVKPIFNESFAEKRGLWVPWTVHGTPLEKHKSHRNVLIKKKKKKKRRRRRRRNAFQQYPNEYLISTFGSNHLTFFLIILSIQLFPLIII